MSQFDKNAVGDERESKSNKYAHGVAGGKGYSGINQAYAAPSEQDRSQAATNDTFSTAKDMLMQKMFNNDGKSSN